MNQKRPAGLIIAALIVLLAAGCASTGDNNQLGYEQLVRQLQRGESRDWDRLDAAFLRLPDFQDRLERLGVLHDLASGGQQTDLIAVAEGMLGLYYGDLRAHEMRHRLALGADDAETAAFHAAAGDALAAAIAASGDGSEQQPFTVLSAPQAYAWLETQRVNVVGALYETDDDAPELVLVVRSLPGEGKPIDEIRFDLTPTFTAAAAATAAISGGESAAPSQAMATLAKQGDSAAETAYAIALWQQAPEYGARAVQWLQSASASGNIVAREMLGVIYGSLAAARSGAEAERLLDAAVDQFLLAVNQGSATAMYNLAQLYLSGHFGEENQPAGVALLGQAAERENLDAIVMLARLHYNGQFVSEDKDYAISLLVQACERGHPEAQLFYARHMLTTDDGIGFDEQARIWLEQAAVVGRSTDAMMLLGSLYAAGEHLERDPVAAVSWFKRAAGSSTDPELINTVAWILVVAEDLELRDPAAGLDMMNTLMGRGGPATENPAYLDTWAAAHAATEAFAEAVEIQQQALTIAEAEEAAGENPEYLPVLREHLELFESGGTVTEAVP